MTKDELQGYITDGMSHAGIADITGKSKSSIRHWLNKYDLKTNATRKRKTPINWTKDLVTTAVGVSINYSEVLRYLGLSTHYGNFETLKKYLKEYDIDHSHFTGAPRHANVNVSRTLEEVMVRDSTYNRSNLKKRLLTEGILLNECSICGLGDEWCGKPIVHQLDHINGINYDHRIENLRMLCGNCHGQTPTYAGRNKGNKKPKLICMCGNAMTGQSKQCKTCFHKSNIGVERPDTRKVPRPTAQQLIEDLSQNPWTHVGKKYGVSDNAVRKWCRSLDLPTDRKELKEMYEATQVMQSRSEVLEAFTEPNCDHEYNYDIVLTSNPPKVQCTKCHEYKTL
jgi:hypothetical protein